MDFRPSLSLRVRIEKPLRPEPGVSSGNASGSGNRGWPMTMIVILACFASVASATASTGGGFDLPLSWAWTPFGDAPGGAGLIAADVDGDGALDLLASSGFPSESTQGWGYFYQADIGASIEIDWSALPFPGGLRSVRVAPGVPPRIVAAGASTVLVLDGATKAVAWTYPLPTSELRTFEVADLEGDGILELALCDDDAFFLLDFASGVVRDTSPGVGCTDLEIGQLDTDTQLEIAIFGNPAGGYVLDGIDLEIDWHYPGGFGSNAVLVEVDGDASREIAFADSKRIVAIDVPSGVSLWEEEDRAARFLEAIDTDGDGTKEIVSSSNSDVLLALDEESGAVLWEFGGPELGAYAAAAGDFDLDGEHDLVFGAYSFGGPSPPAALYRLDLKLLEVVDQSDNLGRGTTGVGVEDLGGQGRLSVVTSTYENGYSEDSRLRVFDLPGRRLSATEPEVQEGSRDPMVSICKLDETPERMICRVSFGSPVAQVACLEADTLSSMWTLHFRLEEAPTALACGDIDQDPLDEVLVGTTGPFVFAFEGENGWLKWRSSVTTPNVFAYRVIRAGDYGGPAGSEVLGAGWSPIRRLDLFAAACGANLNELTYDGGLSVEFDQLDSDSDLEVLITLDSGPPAFVDQIVEIDPWTGSTSSPHFETSETILSFRRLDVTGDGMADFAIATADRIKLFNGVTWEELWSSPVLPVGQTVDFILRDLGGSPRPEIVTRTGAGFAVFGDDLSTLFRDGFESGDTSAWSSTLP